MLPYTILYTSPILIPVGILIIIFSKPIASFMSKHFGKQLVRDTDNPFVYKIVGIIIIITSIVGLLIQF